MFPDQFCEGILEMLSVFDLDVYFGQEKWSKVDQNGPIRPKKNFDIFFLIFLSLDQFCKGITKIMSLFHLHVYFGQNSGLKLTKTSINGQKSIFEAVLEFLCPKVSFSREFWKC